MQTLTFTAGDVEAWNDMFAREHDIDEYYSRSSILIRWIEGLRLRAIRRLLRASPAHSILEVGCGGGHVLRQFPANPLVGVDVSGEMIRRARRNLQGLNVELHKNELDAIGFAAGRFDRIVCTEVLEHVLEPEGLLSEIARVLSPRGRLVVTLPNDALILRIKSAIYHSGLRFLPMFRRISWGGDEYHLHLWRPRQMRDMLAKYFAVREIKAIPSRLLPVRYCFVCTPRAARAAEVIPLVREAALKSA